MVVAVPNPTDLFFRLLPVLWDCRIYFKMSVTGDQNAYFAPACRVWLKSEGVYFSHTCEPVLSNVWVFPVQCVSLFSSCHLLVSWGSELHRFNYAWGVLHFVWKKCWLLPTAVASQLMAWQDDTKGI